MEWSKDKKLIKKNVPILVSYKDFITIGISRKADYMDLLYITEYPSWEYNVNIVFIDGWIKLPDPV